MIDTVCGSKRRISNSEENERITLRQMVLNMSICKIQKDQGRKEPSLLRSVVISNTVRNIENEMDEEMMLEFESSDFYTSKPTIQPLKSNIDANNNDIDISDEKVSSENEECNQFGAIGDRRKCKQLDSYSSKLSSKLNNIWDPVTTTVLDPSPLEKMDFDNGFPDVDIALYDFDDTSSFFPQPQGVTSSDWQYFPSCASAYKKSGDSYFEELDQMMQVLVGM